MEVKEEMEEGEVLEEGEISDEEPLPPPPPLPPPIVEEPPNSKNRAPETRKKLNKKKGSSTKNTDIEEFMKKKKEEFDEKVRNQLQSAGCNAVVVEAKDKDDPSIVLPESMEATPATTDATPSTSWTNVAPPAKGPPRYRDLDPKSTTLQVGDPTETMISAWMTGSKKARNSPEAGYDPNDEFYFGKSASPPPQPPTLPQEDKDYREPRGDTDYRSWEPREEEETTNTGAEKSANEFGDRDYRSCKGRSKSSRHDKDNRERRRKRSDTDEEPDDEGRRSREDRRKRSRRSPSPKPSNSRMRSRWERPTICRFFRDGFCRDGDSCSFSHDAADSLRKPELCKYYQQGYCKKSMQCPFLHGEYPCKAFHKGECSKGLDCHYSHTPLSEFTQPIWDKMLRDEELASKIVPTITKRKTLLPAPSFNNGPTGGGMGMGRGPPRPPLDKNGPGGYDDQGMGPPPQMGMPFMPPTAPLGPPPIPPPGLMPMGMNMNMNMMPPNFPGAPLYTPPTPLPKDMPTPDINRPPPLIETTPTISISSPPTVKVEVKEEPPDSAAEPDSNSESSGFNINEMLRKIKAQVEPEEPPEESPASPPPQSSQSSAPQAIPFHGVPIYRLVVVDIYRQPNAVDPVLIQASLTDPKLRNDPRIKKQLDSQFNAVSNLISNQKATRQDAPKEKAASVAADPRLSSRDPRLQRQQTQSSPQQGQPGPTLPSTNSAATGVPSGMDSNMDEQMKVNMQLQLTAMQQAGLQPPGLGMPGPMMPPMPSMDMPGMPPLFPGPQHQIGIAPQTAGMQTAPQTSSWMPNMNTGNMGGGNDAQGGGGGGPDPNENDPRKRGRSSRWNKTSPIRKQSPPAIYQSRPIGDCDERPVSMREKRKDNQYESPLSSGVNRTDTSVGRYNEMPNVKVRRVKVSDSD